ncbi:hypothetical protein D3C72_639170 [compost metagenome]
MGPMVSQLEKAYAGRVAFRVYTLDKLTPEQVGEVQRLAEGAGVHMTPTFLVVDASGRVVSKHEGVTSYLSLSRALDGVLVASPAP